MEPFFAFLVGVFIASCVLVYWWRCDRKEGDKLLQDAEKKLLELDALKKTYIIVEHQVSDATMKFATMDGGLNWYWINESVAGVLIRDRVDPVLDECLVHELCDKIATSVIGSSLTSAITEKQNGRYVAT